MSKKYSEENTSSIPLTDLTSPSTGETSSQQQRQRASQQQPPQPPQQQVTGIAASHAPTTALQQQEPFNTNNQNLGSSDSAAKSQYPSYLSSSNLPTTDNNPSI